MSLRRRWFPDAVRMHLSVPSELERRGARTAYSAQTKPEHTRIRPVQTQSRAARCASRAFTFSVHGTSIVGQVDVGRLSPYFLWPMRCSSACSSLCACHCSQEALDFARSGSRTRWSRGGSRRERSSRSWSCSLLTSAARRATGEPDGRAQCVCNARRVQGRSRSIACVVPLPCMFSRAVSEAASYRSGLVCATQLASAAELSAGRGPLIETRKISCSASSCVRIGAVTGALSVRLHAMS